MAGFFKNNTYGLSEREILTAKYNSARANLLLVVAFTLINIVIKAFGGDTYFLFSASVPYLVTIVGTIVCGKMSDEFYAELEVSKDQLLPQGAIMIFVAIAVIITFLYFLFWLFSKKKVGFMIAALVFFAIDTVVMFEVMGISFNSIIDILMHAWVIYYLIIGIRAYQKRKALPEEEEQTAVFESTDYETVSEDGNAEDVVDNVRDDDISKTE